MSLEALAARIRQFLNPSIKGKNTSALINALAAGDQVNADNIVATKQQLSIMTASSVYLDSLFANLGFERPTGVGIDDELFRQVGIKQTNNKLITNIFLDILAIFYGAEAVQANMLSGEPEGYHLANGMTLSILVDSNPIPLVITFQNSDFGNISVAKASEVANAISRTAFNAGYTLTASAFQNPADGLFYVQLFSGTKGARSAVTVIGGSAQNILQFSQKSLTVPLVGTQFTMSFVNQYVQFTWSGGPNPQLGFLSPGDYVNIFGSQFLASNQGTYTIQNVMDGSVGQAYFQIINPNFQAQSPVTMTQIAGNSGGGTVVSSAFISAIPSGAVRTSNVVTITTISPHGFVPGQKVIIQGVDNTTFNGTFTIVSVGSNTIQYAQNGINSASGGGQASVSYNITSTGAARSGGVTTITTTINHNLTVGHIVSVNGVNDSSFDGAFTITGVGSNTFTYTQNASNDMTFFTPERQIIQKMTRYASVYEVNPHEVVIFMPATATIVKRSLIGSWHVHNSSTDTSFLGSYVYNTKSGFPISQVGTKLNDNIFAGSIKTVTFGTDTSKFPDKPGYLVFEFGTDNQEGPVKYLGRPSSGSLRLDASYKFKKTHLSGCDVRLLEGVSPFIPATDGHNYAAYLTGTIAGRVQAEKLIEQLSAAGIFLKIIVIIPQNRGLQDPSYVYGPDQL